MSDSTIEVRPFRDGDEAGLIALWNAVFGEGAPEGFEPRTLAQWRWLYADNPLGRQILLGVAPDGTIVSHYAGLPARFQVGTSVHVSAQMIDSMVHPAWRQGLQKEGPFLKTARWCPFTKSGESIY